MFTHAKLWSAIDQLAQVNGYSASGLAKKAGLDPTSFNRSKRKGADGKLRWPSTESLSKVLAATNSTMAEFITLMGEKAVTTASTDQEQGTATDATMSAPAEMAENMASGSSMPEDAASMKSAVPAANRHLPLLRDEVASDPMTFDENGMPVVREPYFEMPNGQPELSAQAWALEITGSSFAPYYQEGDILLIDPNGPARAGDPFLIRRKSEDRLAVYRGQSANPVIGIPLGRIMGAFYSMSTQSSDDEQQQELAA
ncbi:MAG: helix-turn-helix transcriptional regulator [Rhodospirillales bacterium]|nr:helix-turn-helix transcriptional regulator [Rhodospirillales bacterium]